MNFSIRILTSIEDILASTKDTIKSTNIFTRKINTVLKEIDKLSEKYCEIVQIPQKISQLGIKGPDSKSPDFINKFANNANEFRDFNNKITNMSPGSIMSEVINLQFNVPKNTFTECEHILESLRNS